MNYLYPITAPYKSYTLSVSDIHTLHIEETGNPDGIPVLYLHGRYDMICKLEASYLLQQALPNSTLNIVPDAGHSTSEPNIAAALKDATDLMAKLI